MKILDKNSRLRYARQIAIPEIGENGQKRLIEGKVLIVGCGALGSMIAMQLAGAGVGSIGIVDYDNIEISNIQRQFFFDTADVGKSKATILERRIKDLNPSIQVTAWVKLITRPIALEIFKDYDFIIDATDNPDSKRVIDNVSKELGKPCCIGGVRDFMGQVITLLPKDLRFDDIFGSSSIDSFLPCSFGGVMGPAAAFCASVQASEAIKYLIGIGNLLSGKLMTFNLLSGENKIFKL